MGNRQTATYLRLPLLPGAIALALSTLLAMLATPAAPLADDEDLLPRRWGGWYALGHDDRRLGPLGDGDPDSGTGDPAFWFAEPEDIQLSLRLWALWKTRLWGKRARGKLTFERQEWAQGQILGRNIWQLELRHDLDDASALGIEVEHQPQVYRRHRVDKDAAPGEPRYRPQAYRETEVELSYRREWSSGLESSFQVAHTNRDERPWFNERDRWRNGVGVSLEFPVTATVRLEPTYEYRVSRSRNEPDLGSDLSYREHLVELRLRADLPLPGGPWEIEGRNRWKFRRYTTDDPTDERRFHRNEQIYSWNVRVRRADAPLTPFLSAESSGRWADSAADPETVEDEDGEVDRTLIRLGVEWTINLEDEP